MDKQKLINLVKKIQNSEGTEDEIDEMIDLFRSSVSDPEAFNYIFSKEYNDLSAEEIVSKALKFKPTLLPAPATSEEE